MRPVFFLALLLALAASAPAATRPDVSGASVIAVAARSGIVLVDPELGERTAVTGTVPGDSAPALAPDGRRLAFSSARTGNAEIHVVDLWTGSIARLTNNRRATDTAPSWSPDGKAIAWVSGRPGAYDVHVMAADGGRKRLLAGEPGDQLDPDWSPDGARLVFSSSALGEADLWIVAASSGEPEPLTQLAGQELHPEWSPSGRWVAYVRAAGNLTAIEVVPAAGGDPRRVATGGTVAWSPTGVRLAVAAARGSLQAVSHFPSAEPPSPLLGLEPSDEQADWSTLSIPVGPAPRAGERLPDLDQRAPTRIVVIREGRRTKLGFASAVDNVGTGPLRIRGVRPAGSKRMRAHQLVELSAGGLRAYHDVGSIRFTPHPPHFHWHFEPFERYELRRASDFTLVSRDRKIGFCLADHYGHAARRVLGFGPPRFLGDCGKSRPELRVVEQGSSVGYTDRYGPFFHGQSVDVSELPAGLYVLVHRANPELLTHELRYDNNAASVLLRLERPHAPGALPTVRVLASCEGRERCRVLSPT